jgi:hypothetical protein
MKTTDAEIRQKLVGTWITPAGSKWHFAANGTYSHEQRRSSYAGTWQVTENELIMTIANYFGPPKSRSPIGHAVQCTIVRVNDKELVEEIDEALVTLDREAA